MKNYFSFPRIFLLFFPALTILHAFRLPVHEPDKHHFPYASQGLTTRQAAAHMLNRFTYGATPVQIDEVVGMGLENWFEKQLAGGLPDDSLQNRLIQYDVMRMSSSQLIQSFPKPIQLLRMALQDGVIAKDSVKLMDKDEYKKRLAEYGLKKNIRQQSELIRQLISQRILRAAYSQNQLHEVLTGFWFNHFNISMTNRETVLFMPAYERDAIRPYVTGSFESLLMATAKSPAMLIYLDNFSSSFRNDKITSKTKQRLENKTNYSDNGQEAAFDDLIKKYLRTGKNQGLNENYAREVMELHTLGVDGGYTQSDVTQAARILTGWSIFPVEEEYSPHMKRIIDTVGEQELYKHGYVREGDFLFDKYSHDDNEKTVLGKIFPSNGGYAEGITLLKMLANHPSTARFISRKLATYFVADTPPESLVKKMTVAFLESGGDIKKVLTSMVYAPEFWNKDIIGQKTKSPFELAISAVRVFNADLEIPYQLFERIDRMGQRIYHFQAPTGFPDNAQYWVNTGALLNRLNFGMDFASQRIKGVNIDLLKLNHYHEPESAESALVTYASLLLPEKNMQATIKKLTQLLSDPDLDVKIQKAAEKINAKNGGAMQKSGSDRSLKAGARPVPAMNMLAQVAGIIIGSPDFQRR